MISLLLAMSLADWLSRLTLKEGLWIFWLMVLAYFAFFIILVRVTI